MKSGYVRLDEPRFVFLPEDRVRYSAVLHNGSGFIAYNADDTPEALEIAMRNLWPAWIGGEAIPEYPPSWPDAPMPPKRPNMRPFQQFVCWPALAMSADKLALRMCEEIRYLTGITICTYAGIPYVLAEQGADEPVDFGVVGLQVVHAVVYEDLLVGV